MGFKVLKIYQESRFRRYYSSDDSMDEDERLFKMLPYSADQDALKECVEEFEKETKGNQPDSQPRIALILKSLHKIGQTEIKRLIKARNKHTPPAYEWLLVAIVPMDDSPTRKIFRPFQKDRRIKDHFQLLLVLRGGTSKSATGVGLPSAKSNLPSRHTNPWLNSNPGQRRLNKSQRVVVYDQPPRPIQPPLRPTLGLPAGGDSPTVSISALIDSIPTYRILRILF